MYTCYQDVFQLSDSTSRILPSDNTLSVYSAATAITELQVFWAGRFSKHAWSSWKTWTRIEPPLSCAGTIGLVCTTDGGYRHPVRLKPLPPLWIHSAILRIQPCITHEGLISLISDMSLIASNEYGVAHDSLNALTPTTAQ